MKNESNKLKRYEVAYNLEKPNDNITKDNPLDYIVVGSGDQIVEAADMPSASNIVIGSYVGSYSIRVTGVYLIED